MDGELKSGDSSGTDEMHTHDKMLRGVNEGKGLVNLKRGS